MIIHELKTIQEEHGYLPAEELQALSRRLNVPLYRLHGVASFYPHFRLQPPPVADVQVCSDIACFLRGATDVHAIVQTAADSLGLTDIRIRPTSCLGQCDEAPAIAINDQYYTEVNAQRITGFLQTVASGRTLRRQRATPTSRTFACNPYVGAPTYEALQHLQHQGDAAAVLTELKQSGLRGMGGAGFPTGTKWELVHNTPGEVKYVVCNADESEPGTFKDRVILQYLPELVIEGMAIAALVVGARQVIIYLRHEYARERETLHRALRQCQAQGLLGDLTCEIFDSPGGYICGEETALLEALEDKRAEPRNKPPFPGTYGLFGKPTLINNVETFAMVPGILLKGGAWWAAHGKNGASGLKFLAVSGHVSHPGV
jgi:NADH:ubiquinone oxidoreductase subunit E